MASQLDAFLQPQYNMPILAALQTLAKQPDAAFYAPGHKRGRGIPQPLAALLGNLVFQADLPELPQLDNLFAPEGVIKQAQSLAAEVFGATQTWFLVNGSTCGVIAAILATCGTGDKIILPRNIHQSAIAGLILSGAMPIFIYPEYNSQLDLAYSITPEAVASALRQHPDAKAVMIVYPTYHGICGDIEAIAQIVHSYDIPLLVDEAHGAHFTFHQALPPAALSAGADLSVQSTHKVLGAMTQASMLHIQGTRIDAQRLTQALQLLQSTSPSYLLLATLDAARQQMALYGGQLLSKALTLAEDARSRLRRIPGLSVLELAEPLPGFRWHDQTRLTVNVAQLGLSGFEVDEIFCQQFGVTAELPMLRHITFIITCGNTSSDIDQLVQAFTNLSHTPHTPHTHHTPREAYFSPSNTVAIGDSVKRISAELICPYPPGIPVLMPGEVITENAIAYLQNLLTLGATMTGCSDISLKTIKVI